MPRENKQVNTSELLKAKNEELAYAAQMLNWACDCLTSAAGYLVFLDNHHDIHTEKALSFIGQTTAELEKSFEAYRNYIKSLSAEEFEKRTQEKIQLANEEKEDACEEENRRVAAAYSFNPKRDYLLHD